MQVQYDKLQAMSMAVYDADDDLTNIGNSNASTFYYTTLGQSHIIVQNATNLSVWLEILRDTCSFTLERCCINVH